MPGLAILLSPGVPILNLQGSDLQVPLAKEQLLCRVTVALHNGELNSGKCELDRKINIQLLKYYIFDSWGDVVRTSWRGSSTSFKGGQCWAKQQGAQIGASGLECSRMQYLI